MSFLKKVGRKRRNAYIKQPEKPAGGRKFLSGAKKPSIRTVKLKAGAASGFKSALLGLSALLLIGVIITAVGAGALWLYEQATTSDFFMTKHIDIAGNVRLSRGMVLQYSGLNEGDNSLAVSISDVERNLRSTPWVEEVSVKRLLPDRFVIKLKERMPSFWVRKDNALFYANETGEPIAPVESKNFLSLPTLSIEAGAEDSVPYLARLLKDIQSGSLPIESGAIASVSVSPARGVEIYLEDREMRISIATDDWEGNLSRLGAALGDLARRRELANVREARASDGHVWIVRNSVAHS